MTSAALNYRANAPVVDAMLRELGLVNGDEGSLHDLLNGNNVLTSQALNQPIAPKSRLNGHDVDPHSNREADA